MECQVAHGWVGAGGVVMRGSARPGSPAQLAAVPREVPEDEPMECYNPNCRAVRRADGDYGDAGVVLRQLPERDKSVRWLGRWRQLTTSQHSPAPQLLEVGLRCSR
jgi:hypothetical protein